jgi:hypothetical protein
VNGELVKPLDPVDQIEALPSGSVALDKHGRVWQKQSNDHWVGLNHTTEGEAAVMKAKSSVELVNAWGIDVGGDGFEVLSLRVLSDGRSDA